MKNSGRNISLSSYDDIFTTEETRGDEEREKVQMIDLSALHLFRNHPFKVKDDEAMANTVESVKQYGVLVPAIARPLEEGGYELVAGHRRHHACELAGLTEMPVIVRDLDDDEATIIMVDSNLQRESLLPSERAFAYKMKLDAIKHQGSRSDLTSMQVAQKLSVERVGGDAGLSKDQVRRFIRLTALIPDLLNLVDDKKIAFNPAVELSYLKIEEQVLLLDAMESEQASPSLSQAQRLKKFSQEGSLSVDVMRAIMSEEKKPEQDKLTFTGDKLRKYFPKSYTPEQMETTIIRLLEQWQKKRQHEASRQAVVEETEACIMAVFRVERTRDYTVMSNHHLKNRMLSLKAKGLLSIMLSLPDEWDYTLRGLAAISKEGVDAIRQAILELEEAGYIVRARSRNNKGQLSGTEYVIYEHPQPVSDSPVLESTTQENPVMDSAEKERLKHAKSLSDNVSKEYEQSTNMEAAVRKTPMWENPILDNPTLENPTLDKPTLENPTQLNTKESKTYPESKKPSTTSIYPSIPLSHPSAQRDGSDMTDMVKKFQSQVRNNIDYFELSEGYETNLEQLDEIVDLMVETLCSARPTISVAGDSLPASLVKERLLKINSQHIEYVMNSLKANTTPVRNIKRYLLTVLFNAPATIDNYYTAQFQHEYYGVT